jgi:hypothetical protein
MYTARTCSTTYVYNVADEMMLFDNILSRLAKAKLLAETPVK